MRRSAFCCSLPSTHSFQSPSQAGNVPATALVVAPIADHQESHPSPVTSMTDDSTTSFPPTRPAPNLLTSDEAWREADDHFKVEVISAVLEMSLPEEKNEVLSDGIYSYFAGKYGCRMRHNFSKQRKNNKPHNRVLSSVTQQLKEARKEYRQSKREGLSAESL